jgi:hypothetical protein
MTLKLWVAACLTVSAPPKSLVPTAPAPVVETAEWFHLSLEPVSETEAAPVIGSGAALSRSATDGGQPSQKPIQVPAPVQNLRRADH